MKIAVLGCGAMGMLVGGYLSTKHDVYLIDVDKTKVDSVNEHGITIDEKDGTQTVVKPVATMDSSSIGEVDVVIMFVKAMFSKSALDNNKSIIGENTYLMTLQNGAGHEDLLKQYVKEDKVIIGVTNHNSSIKGASHIYHGGAGVSYVGLPFGESSQLQSLAEGFTDAGIETLVDDNICKLIWNKLFINATVSALTGVLQVPIGYIGENESARKMMETLVTEAVAVANAEGMGFDEAEIQKKASDLTVTAKDGLTSIYADIRDGRKTEVDTISGAVVKASHRTGVKAPSHELIVNMVHALEGKV